MEKPNKSPNMKPNISPNMNMAPNMVGAEQSHHHDHHHHDHHHKHKLKMYELCSQFLHQKVYVKTIHGDQFHAIVDHVTPDIVYLMADHNRDDDQRGWGGYGGFGGGYGGGFGGNPASYAVAWGVPLVLLATIGAASGYGGGFGW